MKTQYICEKCGANYTNYDEAYACENKHYMLNLNDMAEELNEYIEYGKGKEMPSNFVAASEEISEWNEEKQEFDHRRILAEYKLVRIIPEREAAPILAKHTERKERERREWDEYWNRRKAEKEAKEQAEKAESKAE